MVTKRVHRLRTTARGIFNSSVEPSTVRSASLRGRLSEKQLSTSQFIRARHQRVLSTAAWEHVRITIKHLDGNVVCPGVSMLHHTAFDRFSISPGHNGVKEPIAASVGKVVVGESQASEVCRVVREVKVP